MSKYAQSNGQTHKSGGLNSNGGIKSNKPTSSVKTSAPSTGKVKN